MFFVILAAGLSLSAHAAKGDWTAKLEKYRQDVQTFSAIELYVSQAGNVSKTFLGCTGSVVASAAAFCADTIPLLNPVAETIGNLADQDYQTYGSLLDWENLANAGRGSVGGAAVASVEALEFVLLWLAGNEEQSFEALKKVYASTFATVDAMFSNDSACYVNLGRIQIVRAEWQRRSGKMINYTPMNLR